MTNLNRTNLQFTSYNRQTKKKIENNIAFKKMMYRRIGIRSEMLKNEKKGEH